MYGLLTQSYCSRPVRQTADTHNCAPSPVLASPLPFHSQPLASSSLPTHIFSMKQVHSIYISTRSPVLAVYSQGILNHFQPSGRPAESARHSLRNVRSTVISQTSKERELGGISLWNNKIEEKYNLLDSGIRMRAVCFLV